MSKHKTIGYQVAVLYLSSVFNQFKIHFYIFYNIISKLQAALNRMLPQPPCSSVKSFRAMTFSGLIVLNQYQFKLFNVSNFSQGLFISFCA